MNNAFDLAEQKYKNYKKQSFSLNPSDKNISRESQPKSENPFDIAERKYKHVPSFEEDNDLQRNIERNQAQLTSRGLESIAGLPGDLMKFVGNLFDQESTFPGSKELRKFSEESSSGYTSPQNQFEEKAGDLMQDISLFAIPGAKHYSVARNIGIPIVSELAKEGVKNLGGGEGKQSAAKIGSMVLLDILSHRKSLGTAKDYASSLFQQADEAIPKGLSINASNLEKSLLNLENTLKAGGEKPTTGDALKKINEIKNEIKNGKIDLKNLVAYRPSINEWIDKYKGFDIQASPAIRKKIINNLNKVKKEVINSAEEYGKKYNPRYLKLSQSANEAYSAVSQSNKITNFIDRHVATKLKSTAAKSLLGIAYGGSSIGLGGLTGAVAGGVTATGGALSYKLFKTILRSKSPTLRNHYFNIIEGAAKGNASLVIKNAKALDKELLNMDITGEIDQE